MTAFALVLSLHFQFVDKDKVLHLPVVGYYATAEECVRNGADAVARLTQDGVEARFRCVEIEVRDEVR